MSWHLVISSTFLKVCIIFTLSKDFCALVSHRVLSANTDAIYSGMCCVLSHVWLSATPWTAASHGDSPGKNTGVGCHAFLQGFFPSQVSHTAGRFLTVWAPGKPKNTGVDSLSLLQGIFPTRESNQGLLHCRRILYQLSYQGSPYLGIGDTLQAVCSEKMLGGMWKLVELLLSLSWFSISRALSKFLDFSRNQL